MSKARKGSRPSPAELYEEAGGDRQKYIELMKKHKHLVPGKPTDLACGWPSNRVRASEPEAVEEGQA